MQTYHKIQSILTNHRFEDKRMNTLEAQLITFVQAQAPSKPIDHYSWDKCAVGEFADHINYPRETPDIGRGFSLRRSGKIDEYIIEWLCGAKTYGEAVENMCELEKS